MDLKMNRLVYVLLTAAFLAAACAPGQGTPAGTDVADQVATAVAATVAAIQTATAAAVTETLTPTPSLTPTPTPVLPTATPFVVTPPTSTGGGGGGGGGGGAGSPTYSCDPDIGKRPRDNSEYHSGDDFDVKWTILNTGSATWPAGTDLTYFSGPQMTSATFFELPEMKPGDTYSVVMDANAPAQKGFQVMTWRVQGGYCYPYVAINVK